MLSLKSAPNEASFGTKLAENGWFWAENGLFFGVYVY